MREVRYLVDNNALGDLGPARCASEIFRRRCRVPEDVAYEARGRPWASSLAELIAPVTPDVLKRLKGVMRTVPTGDTSLVDLYANKGAADPVIVATALSLRDEAAASLFPEEWVIVTHDKAVVSKAEEFSILTMVPDALARLIDESGERSGAPRV